MKISFRILALVFAAMLESCAVSPRLLEQTSSARSSIPATNVLIVVDGKAFGNPPFGPGGHAYMDAMGFALQEGLTGLPVHVVTIDPMQLENPEMKALNEIHPNYVLRLRTLSVISRNAVPITAVWQLDASEVSTTASRLPGQPQLTRTQFNFRAVYRARAQGPTCSGSLLGSEDSARRCGGAMGKVFADALLDAQVFTPRQTPQ
ncbi:hypothetical protein M0D69_30070 [Caballeronia sp. SEWSISQ10-4 2]|uniref:hypothetical protein n=1 Tax=Caballeronia sp. SEWSISQ10-4 2 TaxID=2937438 RepID=UPI00264C63AC|nr:hypothetical protein [Caballeronia sp. SEWSISQ10-4 2]MDN7182187.1 hypothetical protein [Caballeronia sp. SEWSISQ10-4 2]